MKRKTLVFILTFIILISTYNALAINQPIEKDLEQQYIPVHYKPKPFFVEDNYFFEITRFYEITISEISNPYFTRFVSNYYINQSGSITKLYFRDNLIYILYFDEFEGPFDYEFYQVSYAIELVNISDIYNPTFVSRLDIAGINELDYYDFEISENYCYLITNDYNEPNYCNLVHMLNFTDILNPEIVSIISLIDTIYCWIKIRNDNMFLVCLHSDSNSSFTIWDISNKTDWERLYLEVYYDIFLQNVFLKDNYLFFFSNNKIKCVFQYDINNLSEAILVRTIQFDTSIWTINFWDEYMGVVSKDGFKTYNIDEIETNQSLDYFGSIIKDDGYFYDGIFDNNRIYLSRLSWEKSNRIFFILDVSNPYDIQMIYPRNPYVISIVPPVVIITSIVGLIVIISIIKQKKQN